MKYKAAIFDMDGTVLDTLSDLADSVNYSLSRFGFPEVSRDKVRMSLGNGAEYLIRSCAPSDIEETELQSLLSFYKEWYNGHCIIKTAPYDGILPLMDALSTVNVKVAIVSNKPDPTVRELSARFFGDRLDFSLGERPGVRRKPEPDTVLAAVEELGLSVSECVYIGDSEVDVETARRAKMDCIGVAWGFRGEESLRASGAELIAAAPEDIFSMILLS